MITDRSGAQSPPAREPAITDWPMVTRLRRHRAQPCVSLLAAGADPETFRREVDELLRTAAKRLRSELPADAVDELLAPLDALTRSIDPPVAGESIGYFASAEVVEVVRIPEPVRSRVAIDDTFATRDLVSALLRTTSYAVVAVSRQVARYFEDVGTGLTEVTNANWPLRAPAERRSADPTDPERRRRSDDRRFVRTVDITLSEQLRRRGLPLVVVTTPVLQQHLGRVTARPDVIDVVVHGGIDELAPDEMAALVDTSIQSDLQRRRDDALDAIDVAVGQKRCASGIDEVWSCANDGRGELLVVEEGFAFPAHISASGQHLLATDDVEHPEVVDDMVDDVIEQVLATRGRVMVLPDGTLDRFARIALALRY